MKTLNYLPIIITLSFLYNTQLSAMNVDKTKKDNLNPYNNTVFVTNTITWPYNSKTFGTDSFQLGSVESGNEDSVILKQAATENLLFPEKFGWAVACSAYQYEGNRIEPSEKNINGIGWSVWDTFCKPASWLNQNNTNIAQVPPTSDYTFPSGKNAIKGFYPEYYKNDINTAAELGVKYFRLSISWPRLFPEKGMDKADKEGLKYYIDVLEYLKKKNLTPLITLYHWDLPAWLYNYGKKNIPDTEKTYGWLDLNDAYNNLLINEFQKYAETCFKEFGKYTRFFATFNEPLTFSNNGLYICNHAPGKGGWELLRAKNPAVYGSTEKENLERLNYIQSGNIIKAHYVAYKTFDKYREQISAANDNQKALLSIVLNSDWAEPYRIIQNRDETFSYHPDDIKASQRNMDFMLGWWLDPVMNGNWPESMIENVGIMPKGRLPDLYSDSSWLSKDGKLSAEKTDGAVKLSDYIKKGGAADCLFLNHYTGYFAVDPEFAKANFSTEAVEGKVPPNQYGGNPKNMNPGWDSDQNAFLTQFRYCKYGASGQMASESGGKVYVIGNSGNYSWLRQTWFVYRKLLRYIQYKYFTCNKKSKSGTSFKDFALYLTENGTSVFKESQLAKDKMLKDNNRIEYIKGNLASVHQAINDGVNVKLYTYWSIADNFEWGEGYDSRFGLLYIDYKNLKDPKKSRLKKDSYFYYQNCVKKNGVSPVN